MKYSKMRQFADGEGESNEVVWLAAKIDRVLVPVQPSPTFVKNLLGQLMAAPGENRARLTSSRRRGVFIGAAALGSAMSLIGIMVYLARNRMQVRAKIAPLS